MNELNEEKLFYERFYALHRDPDMLSLFERFGIAMFRRSSVLEGFSAFLRDNSIMGKRCVEIGTCKGLTAIVLARHFDEVVSIDVVSDHDRGLVAAHVGARNIRFLTVADNAAKATAIREIGPFDFAYVDGDHARDTESDFDLVRRCGRVLFHEYWRAQPPVFDLVNRLMNEGDVTVKGKLALWTA